MAFDRLAALLEAPVYGWSGQEKREPFQDALREVTRFHVQHCAPYARLCAKRGFDVEDWTDVAEVPYLPTSLFKDTLLLSVPEDEVFREVQSSATSSGRPSRMALDKQTSRRQSRCFNRTVLDRLGNQRVSFIVLDEPSVLSPSAVVSARSSTIKSLLFCASSAQTCLESAPGGLRLDSCRLDALLKEHGDQPESLVIFGFTFILYHHVVRPMLERGHKLHLPGAKIVHIGGWKKLEGMKVTREKLVADCVECFGVSEKDVVDLYGFTEQGGMIYPTCEAGRRHAPAWGEVLVRDPGTLEALAPGRQGLLQFISPIQTSYPGHNVLTEDVGMITGLDDCPCGRKGVTFDVLGRAQGAEVRGCGDIMADKFAG